MSLLRAEWKSSWILSPEPSDGWPYETNTHHYLIICCMMTNEHTQRHSSYFIKQSLHHFSCCLKLSLGCAAVNLDSVKWPFKNNTLPPSLCPAYPCRGSTTMARGWVIFPSMRVLRVCEAFSSRATLMVFLGPSSVQYKLSAIQSTAMPSTVWIPGTNTNCWWEAYFYSTHTYYTSIKIYFETFKFKPWFYAAYWCIYWKMCFFLG